MKRAISALLVAALATSLAGCRVSVHNEEQPEPCLDTDAYVTFSVEVTRPVSQSHPEERQQVGGLEMEIVLQAESVDPDYSGVIHMDRDSTIPIGTVTRNPIVMRKLTPWGGQACWPADKPVLFLLRAFLIPPGSLDPFTLPYTTYDELKCYIEDGENLHSEGYDYLEERKTTVGGADMFPENLRRNDPYVGVQCQYIYIPGGYAGDPLTPKPDLPPRP